MTIDDQNEILQLRKEIERLQGLLDQRATTLRATQSDITSLIENHELITDCCRYSEGLMDEAAVRKKWRLSEDTYTKLGENEAFIERVEAEKVRRTRSGATARERAQQVFVETPAVLGEILRDNSASPGIASRHREKFEQLLLPDRTRRQRGIAS
jgi:preprotein translocase subunit SecD